MGTPERTKNNRIANSLTTFEDSPVFSYLNGLSPIKPVKSIPFTQTINPLTFATLQSVFTSPHASSLKECRFLQRHQLSDPSRPEFSWNTVNENKASANADSKLDDSHKENIDPTPPNNGEVSNMPSYGECSELIVKLLRNPEHVPEDTSNSYHTSEGNLDGVGHVDQNKGSMSSSNWVSLISNPSQSSVDPATSFYTSIKHAIQQNTLSSGDMDFGNLFAQPEEESDMMGNNETHGMNGGSSIPNPSENMDYQHLSGLYSGVSRRCLVFNKDGARAKHLANYSTSGSCMPENDSSPVLPIIGLHLNALTATPKDYNNANIDSSISRRSLISADPFASLHRPPTCSGHELLGTTLTNIPLQRKFDNVNDVVRVEDSCRESGCMESEDINPSSPKKKRRRLEQAGEGEGSCKRCNCKKSKCLKLYCECFAAGVYCVGPCSCVDCFNKPAHEDTVLSTRKQIESRNPLAFAPKVIRGSDSIPEIGDDFNKTPASARHKRGCNCKKSGCLKKYCECYQGGVGCSINCRCEGCKNAFGTKDGSGVVSMAHEFEEEETNATEKVELNRSFQKSTIQDNLEHTIDSALTATPLNTGRHLAHSFSSSKKSTHLISSSSSSSFPASQGFGNPSMFPPPPKFRQLPKTVEEDVMPEFLLECSSNRVTQLPSSPNGKRVSPPKICLKRSPGRRSSRKLILQSIPSFPSLAHNR